MPGLFRTAFRRHPAGVAVITVPGASRPAGFTATSVASLSLDPPLVSFGISGTASSWPHLRDSATAVVHFLGAGQEDIARRFATSGIDRFAPPTRFATLPGGEPVLDGVATWLLVAIESLVPAGDHHIAVCRVTHVHAGAPQSPLLYHDGIYHTL
ncbi:flavin reductase family protein [Actinacidiphila yeochonensis]|uniref:flavin reductase family protein n=1 Tax=Actinacidiphila yeochonensis TaxID=89050 RepID=UPI000564FB76|nr:flavin reductase family protein [Actinacidiphila yeochonensis]